MQTIFQKHLQYLIKNHHYGSLRELEAATGIAKSTLHGIINGAQPTLKTANILAEHFGVSVDYLVFGRLPRNPIEEMLKVGDNKTKYEISIRLVE